MARRTPQARRSTVWRLAADQHGVVSRAQLAERGLSRSAIEHRLSIGKLHRVHRGVYAVGHPNLTRSGVRMAAVLACGPGAVLSHASAAALYAIFGWEREISISLPNRRDARLNGIRIHRVDLPADDILVHNRIPVTSPARTLIDLATSVTAPRLERAVNQADKLNLIAPDELRAEVAARAGQRGVRALRDLLDRDTFALTESELERAFLPLALRAGLGLPETGVRLNGFIVDFLWRELALVVETDGLRYHRTPLQQARDRRRDQVHATAGFTALRFTHRQVVSEPESVRRTLAAVGLRLAGRAA